MKSKLLICALICISIEVQSQRVSYYAYGRGQSSLMLKSDVPDMISFYNSRHNTDVNIPRIGGGYKIGAGVIMMNVIMGYSQHEHYMRSRIKMDEVKQGYRFYKMRYRSRNAVVGIAIPKEDKEHQLNIEFGIGRSIINTGLVQKDGFVSYGLESITNGSYWARSFHYGFEYNYLKRMKKNFYVSGGLSFHFSNPLFFGLYEDQMDYKRGSSYYVLYKGEPYGVIDNNPSRVEARYAFGSIFLGLQYQIDQKL